MRFHQSGATLYVPDDMDLEHAVQRTTHMAIAAHQDDIEIMALHGILQCYGSRDRWFLGVTVTDGSGSARDGIYAHYTDEQMQNVRKMEQLKAAMLGEFAAVALLDFPSSVVKDPSRDEVVDDVRLLLEAARPEVVYIHNLADKHDTHIAVALRTIRAIRSLPEDARPRELYGCEVWRDLDWLVEEDKVALDVGSRENLAAALVGVFDSQIAGGKRYDLATQGRRRAHATYRESHATDDTTGLTYAMNLTPLVQNPDLDIETFVLDHVRRLEQDVAERMRKYVG